MCSASGLFVQMLNCKTGLPPSQNPTKFTPPTVTLSSQINPARIFALTGLKIYDY